MTGQCLGNDGHGRRPQQRAGGNRPFVAPVTMQGISSQAAPGRYCPGKGGNRWPINRNLIALFGVGQEVSSGGPGEKLSAKSHSSMEEELAVATSSRLCPGRSPERMGAHSFHCVPDAVSARTPLRSQEF